MNMARFFTKIAASNKLAAMIRYIEEVECPLIFERGGDDLAAGWVPCETADEKVDVDGLSADVPRCRLNQLSFGTVKQIFP